MNELPLIRKFRKKPIVIEAIQYTGDNRTEIEDFVGDKFLDWKLNFAIETLEGNMVAQVNDWIIKGINGEFYPCKPDIFEKTYEEVNRK